MSTRQTKTGAPAAMARAKAAAKAAAKPAGKTAGKTEGKATPRRGASAANAPGGKKARTAKPKARAKTSPLPAAAPEAERKSHRPPEEKVPAGAIRVRHIHRDDLNDVWNFLKVVFRDVNKQTVEYQRPKSKQRFFESYDDEGIEQLIFETEGEIVGYAECAFEPTGSDNWINPRYFEQRDIRPLFVEELASHPDYQGRGVGSFMLEQLEHLARVRGCTHLVLEVAENNRRALTFYKKRSFYRLDAAVFMAKHVENEPELLPPRPLKELGPRREDGGR
jgi:ribosomal protein S18 acetylase RimI-like enzyme